MGEFYIAGKEGIALRTGEEWWWKGNIIEPDVPALRANLVPAQRVLVFVEFKIEKTLAEDVFISAAQRGLSLFAMQVRQLNREATMKFRNYNFAGEI